MAPRQFILPVCLALIASIAAFPTTLVKRVNPPPPTDIIPRKYKTYYAAGDSYSAGPGDNGGDVPGPKYPNFGDCTRRSGAWPMLLKDQLGIADGDFVFGACGEFKDYDIRENQLKGPDFKDPDLVSLTLGGNNNNAFERVIYGCVYHLFPWHDHTCNNALNAAWETVKTIDADLDQTIDLAGTAGKTESSPTRIVLVMGYPVTFNYDDVCFIPKSNRKRITDTGLYLNEKIRQSADRLNQKQTGSIPDYQVVYAEPNPAFDGHRACDDASWIATKGSLSQADGNFGFFSGVYHPTMPGHQALAQVATDTLNTVPARVI